MYYARIYSFLEVGKYFIHILRNTKLILSYVSLYVSGKQNKKAKRESERERKVRRSWAHIQSDSGWIGHVATH